MTKLDKKIEEFENFKSELVHYGYAEYNSEGELVSTVLWDWNCLREYRRYQKGIDKLIEQEEK